LFAATLTWPDCSRECSIIGHKHVCGSDGNTYMNQCYLEVEACRNNSKKLFTVAETECKPGDFSRPVRTPKCLDYFLTR
jgi:hypothetical protein